MEKMKEVTVITSKIQTQIKDQEEKKVEQNAKKTDQNKRTAPES